MTSDYNQVDEPGAAAVSVSASSSSSTEEDRQVAKLLPRHPLGRRLIRLLPGRGNRGIINLGIIIE